MCDDEAPSDSLRRVSDERERIHSEADCSARFENRKRDLTAHEDRFAMGNDPQRQAAATRWGKM